MFIKHTRVEGTTTRNQITLEMLWSCFVGDAKATATRIKALKDKPLHEQLVVLTEIEQTPGLHSDLFGIVASAKKALSVESKENLDAFDARVTKAHGLMPGWE